MAFNATWTPGPEAVAGMHLSGQSTVPGLVLYLDKDSLAIIPPTDPGQWPVFAAFLRQVRDGADQLATVLDVQGGQAHESQS
ncbi:hypothetical protein ATK36_3559 [Amycolatopsis sulphurea]|uniref:Uncharacterized protein n=1 Tax=Amycolatopsis sulphurea TaxID=76022 RepID=A0A2A9FDG4_9PSEU|nr:hypothetical protein [Amycolatopsis sulphurea]PFG48469.1 hypothetical protein ATK36_3559 [Amycolatopsis sulphurea]